MRLDKFHSDLMKKIEERLDSQGIELFSEGDNAETAAKKIAKFYTDSIIAAAENISPIFYGNLVAEMPLTLEEERSETKDFEERLLKTWKEAFDYLEALIIATEELSTAFLEESNTTDEVYEEIDFLLKIHAKSIVIAKEILRLLKSGFVDGAMARWRSLHEANVIFHVLSNTYTTDKKKFLIVKQRFLDYSKIDEYKRYVTDWKNEFSVERKRHIEKERKIALETYGQKFGNNYGWAYPLVHEKQKEIYFNDLVKLADYQRTNIHYKEANHHVHISSAGINESLSFMSFHDNSETLLYGPSNYGLSKPGQLTSISLVQITTRLLLLETNTDKFIHAAALKKFAEKCIDIFDETQTAIREVELNRHE